MGMCQALLQFETRCKNVSAPSQSDADATWAQLSHWRVHRQDCFRRSPAEVQRRLKEPTVFHRLQIRLNFPLAIVSLSSPRHLKRGVLLLTCLKCNYLTALLLSSPREIFEITSTHFASRGRVKVLQSLLCSSVVRNFSQRIPSEFGFLP